MSQPAKTKPEARFTETDLDLAQIIPDGENRDVVAQARHAKEEWESLVDSIRVWGVLNRVDVCERGDGTYDLIDGERRWRAAGDARREQVPVRVWPLGTRRADVLALGITLNVQRREHGCLDVARRLRELKNVHAESAERLSQRTGLPLERVKNYLALYEATDELLEFLQRETVPLRVGVELVRLHKVHGALALRRVLAGATDEPLTVAAVAAARRALDGRSNRGQGERVDRPTFALPRALTAALARGAAPVVNALSAPLGAQGYVVVRVPSDPAAAARMRAFLDELGALTADASEGE